MPEADAKCYDVLLALNIAQSNQAVKYIPQTMRDVLIRGLEDCMNLVCEAAWVYYSNEDVPISPQTEPLLRLIVQHHFQ